MGIQLTYSNSGGWILAATTLASSTAFLLGAAVNIAIPSIQKYFGSDITGIEWVINAQLLFLATLLLIGGSLGDYFGRKRIFLLGISIFTLASILAGLAPSISWLIVFQSIQGIGSALMVPQSLAIINASFEERERGKVIGLWAGISGTIAAIGPWIGGWLVEAFSWRAVFFISTPISLSALLIAWFYIPENVRSDDRKLDWAGTALIFLGLLGISYALITAQVSGWRKAGVIVGLVLGVFSLLIFLITEKRKKDALVPPQIFNNPLVVGANLSTLLLYFALNGVFFFLVLDLQQIQGYSPSLTGLGLLTPTILIGIFSGPAGSLADKIGPRPHMILGPFVVAAGAALLSIIGDTRGFFVHFFPGLILVGLGMAIVIAPLTKSALMVKPAYSGIASGVNNAVARFTALMAIALLSTIVLFTFSSQLQHSIDDSALTQTQKQQVLDQSTKLGGLIVPDSFGTEAKILAQQIVNQSFIYSFRLAMGICSVMAVGAGLVGVFMIHNPKPSPSI